ncbi:MAG TPA: hypothetical protein VFU76_09115 [Terriglobales bacterium]|nr:hypothetical protein [Terriglobales bacterium]
MSKRLSVIVIAIFFFSLAAAAAAQTVPAKLYDGLRWRLVGPFRGGRVEAVAGVSGDPQTYYFGAVGGGVWKTSNGGESWMPISDRQGIFAIGAITVDPTDPNVIYVGTGEPCLRNDITAGDGVYKSTDGGRTWSTIGLRDSRHIAEILVDPKNPQTVFVAAVGHAFGPNAERGVFRSNDGGKNWQKVLYVDDKTGATDLVFDPKDPKVLYAAMYEVRRTAYSMISGGPGSGLYKSTDGGSTWKKLEGNGLPSGILGRIGLAVSGANSQRVYAMIEAKENAIYRSDDGGGHWTMVNNEPIWVRPWYGNHIYADPQNADTVYVLDLNAMRSTDGGRSFRAMPVPHTDDHHLWIDPANPKRMIEADDGGASISIDGGNSWSAENNQPTGQFYHAATDSNFNYRIYGSQQDSGSVAILSRSDTGSIGEREWHSIGGGESGYNWPDPRDPQIVYAGDHNGHFTRYDGHTGQVQNIAPFFGARAWTPAGLKHRFQWTSPMLISPHDPNVLYLGGEVVFKTTTGGMSWQVISPDLTRNDKTKQQSSPTPLTPDNSSSEYYDTVFAIAESPVQQGLIWAGSDDGLVHLTRDGGKNWTKVTPAELPEWSRVNMIEASPWDAGTAYMAADLHFNDDFRPMIFKTTDFGKTWTPLVSGIPANDYVHSVHVDPQRKGLLYAGTESGVYVSFDDGRQWQSLQLNLPHSPVYDTAIHGNDLIVATHGRGFWVLDNIAPLRQVNGEMASSPAQLFTPAVAYRERRGGFFGGQGGGRAVGQNPPAGAAIDFYLAEVPSQPVTIEIRDASGQVVHKATLAARAESEARGPQRRGAAMSPAVKAGMNRYFWNYRVAGPSEVPGLFVMEAQAGGPMVPPGSYQVKLTAAGRDYTAPLEIKADPRVKVSQADLEKQYQFALQCRDRVTEIHDLVNRLRAARAELANLRRASSGGMAELDAVSAKMSAIEEQLVQVNSTNRSAALVFPIMLDAQFADLANVAEGADSAPPQQVYDAFQEYDKKREQLFAQWTAMQPQIAELKSKMGGTANAK